MADALDAPTVYRQGAPTLGVPVLSLAYRQGGEAARVLDPVVDLPPPPPLWPISPSADRIGALETRLATLEAAWAAASRPWWVRLEHWLRVHWTSIRRLFHGK